MSERVIQVNTIKVLTDSERLAIADALDEYIVRHPKNSWAQAIVRDEMLDSMMWGKP